MPVRSWSACRISCNWSAVLNQRAHTDPVRSISLALRSHASVLMISVQNQLQLIGRAESTCSHWPRPFHLISATLWCQCAHDQRAERYRTGAVLFKFRKVRYFLLISCVPAFVLGIQNPYICLILPTSAVPRLFALVYLINSGFLYKFNKIISAFRTDS